MGLVQSGVGAVQRELVALQKLGIITQEKKGNQSHFRANSKSPIYVELKGIVQKMDGWVEVLRKSLMVLGPQIQRAFIYGSYASHTQDITSDVDLFVVGDVDEMVLHRAVADVESRVSKTINYTLLNRKEFAKRRREKGGFVERVFLGPKILLIGDGE